MKNNFFYVFIIAIISLVVGFFLFGSGYDFKQHRLQGEKKIKREKSGAVYDHLYPINLKILTKDGLLKIGFKVAVKSEKGVREIEKKIDRVKFGVKLVLSKYRNKQINRKKLERSTLKKVIQSQIRDKVLKVEITDFEKS